MEIDKIDKRSYKSLPEFGLSLQFPVHPLEIDKSSILDRFIAIQNTVGGLHLAFFKEFGLYRFIAIQNTGVIPAVMISPSSMNNIKIALIAPPYPLEEAPSPPLGLCYVAAACEAAGAQVIILDYIVSKYSPEKLRTSLDDFRPDVIGATSVTMNFPKAIDIIRDAKAHMPEAITMMGGPHVSFDVENTLESHPELDLIVIGEAEQTLHELIPVIRSRSRWPQIAGIAYCGTDRVVRTPERSLIVDLDTLPKPARHLLPMSRYQALGFPVSVITSRGCPNRCIFCLGRRMVGNKPRFRSPDMVVDEIEGLLAGGMTIINVADDLFTANRGRVHALCEEIQRRGLDFIWSVFARVNTVDLDLLKAMRAGRVLQHQLRHRIGQHPDAQAGEKGHHPRTGPPGSCLE